MMTLNDTSALLEETTNALSQPEQPASETATTLIDQWIGALSEGENTQEFAGQLTELKTMLQNTPAEAGAVGPLMGKLAQKLTEFSTQVGSEGELPPLLTGLAAALRKAGGTSVADQADEAKPADGHPEAGK